MPGSVSDDSTRHRFIGAFEYNSHNGLMWNLALDPNGDPMLPGTDSCGTPCRPVVTVESGGTWTVNQECERLRLTIPARCALTIGG